MKQMSLSIGKSLRWWEKGLQPNMKEITGAEDLVESLLLAGDKLVVVDFFSPGCGGCKALHPKVRFNFNFNFKIKSLISPNLQSLTNTHLIFLTDMSVSRDESRRTIPSSEL